MAAETIKPDQKKKKKAEAGKEEEKKPEEKVGRRDIGVAGQNWYESPESAARGRLSTGKTPELTPEESGVDPNESQAV